ncbi:MAG: PIN domain-containing protein [Desertifilum sp.]|nr:PIN domain-containing protein [Desertifilum sp.]
MTQYLLDTNIILRFTNPSDAQHQLVTETISLLLSRGDECYLTTQVLVELWVVATRPVDVHGLGWSTEQTRTIINQLLERFPLINETPQIFPTWLNWVTEHQVMGKRTHDVRIVAAMLGSGIKHILTLNLTDFTGLPGIAIALPQDMMSDR